METIVVVLLSMIQADYNETSSALFLTVNHLWSPFLINILLNMKKMSDILKGIIYSNFSWMHTSL